MYVKACSVYLLVRPTNDSKHLAVKLGAFFMAKPLIFYLYLIKKWIIITPYFKKWIFFYPGIHLCIRAKRSTRKT